jgi:hypothetical protein
MMRWRRRRRRRRLRLKQRCGSFYDKSQKTWVSTTGKAVGQIYQCWWRICPEINVFSRFEYHVLHFKSVCNLFIESSLYNLNLLITIILSVLPLYCLVSAFGNIIIKSTKNWNGKTSLHWKSLFSCDPLHSILLWLPIVTVWEHEVFELSEWF